MLRSKLARKGEMVLSPDFCRYCVQQAVFQCWSYIQCINSHFSCFAEYRCNTYLWMAKRKNVICSENVLSTSQQRRVINQKFTRDSHVKFALQICTWRYLLVKIRTHFDEHPDEE